MGGVPCPSQVPPSGVCGGMPCGSSTVSGANATSNGELKTITYSKWHGATLSTCLISIIFKEQDHRPTKANQPVDVVRVYWEGYHVHPR